MKFFVVLALIGVAIVFAVKRCSPSPGGDGQSLGLVSSLNPLSQNQLTLPVASEPAKPQFQTSIVYTFNSRLVPDLSDLDKGTKGDSGVSFVIDRPSNSVLVRGFPEAVAGLRSALVQLDKPSEEAFLDASLFFVQSDKVRDFEAGISFVEGFTPTGRFNLSPDGFGVVLPWERVRLSLSWASSNGVLEVLERPQIRIASGVESSVSTGQDVAVPTTTFRDNVTSTSIEFRRVGLDFKVLPLFLENNRVKLNIQAENGVLGPSQKIDNIEVPSIAIQSVQTVATLGFGDGLVVGGLETFRRRETFGLLGKSEELKRGRLYVVLKLSSGHPRAIPVEPASWEVMDQRPTLPGCPDLPGSILPPLHQVPGWQEQEDEFIRRKMGPPHR